MKIEDLHDAETRVTDYATGGQKGVKITQMGALDPVAMIILSRVAGTGATKYAAFNFLKGYDWSFSYNAMMRHAMLFWAGEDIDVCNRHGGQEHAFVYDKEHPENNCDGTNLPHPALAAWHGHTLTAFWARGIGTDDRPPKLTPALTFTGDSNSFKSPTDIEAQIIEHLRRFGS
jgi:hypothetical protein